MCTYITTYCASLFIVMASTHTYCTHAHMYRTIREFPDVITMQVEVNELAHISEGGGQFRQLVATQVK